MNRESITTARKLHALPWVYLRCAAFTVANGLTFYGNLFPLFLNDLGLTKTRIGLVFAIPHVLGLLALFISKQIARHGPKRIFTISVTIRTLLLGLLIFAPAMLARYGVDAAFFWVLWVTLAFALFRIIGALATSIWFRECVPDHVRGRASAVMTIVGCISGMIASAFAALVIKHFTGFAGYNLLMGIGVIFGLLSIAAMSPVPGGKPIAKSESDLHALKDILVTLRDKNFVSYLGGYSLFTLGIGVFAFVPLYLNDQIGMSKEWIILMSMVVMAGSLCSSYLWGWSADRFGSKPVLLMGIGLQSMIPVLLFLLPRDSHWSIGTTAIVYLLFGLGSQCFACGCSRYFYTGILQKENASSAYYSIELAASGLVAAIAPLFAGWMLDLCRPIDVNWLFIHLDAFTPLFALSGIMFLGSGCLFRRLKSDGPDLSAGAFGSMFLQGNPFMAFGSMLRYHMARDENSRITTTEQMGQAKNPLNVDDLLQALSDPSFNVRYEAIVSLARMPINEKVTNAIVDILRSKEPDLSIAAGWALGRIGDRRAIPALRETLVSEYALLRSRSARSLALMHDLEVVPVLLAALKSEEHDGIRVAYASALGGLRIAESMDAILMLLHRLTAGNLRDEVTLAVARLVGEDKHYVRLWRAARSDFGTSCSEAVMALRKKMVKTPLAHSNIQAVMEECAQAMAANDIKQGADLLHGIINECCRNEMLHDLLRKVLTECANRLSEFKDARKEYILLALNTLNNGVATFERESELRKRKRSVRSNTQGRP